MRGGLVHRRGVVRSVKASMQRVSNDPPTFVLRLHQRGGDWRTSDKYVAVATITISEGVAAIYGLMMRNDTVWSKAARTAVLEAVAREGGVELSGTRADGRSWEFVCKTGE